MDCAPPATAALLATAQQHPVTLLVLTAVLATFIPWAVSRWKYRHIPGPFSLPIIGDLPWVAYYGMHEYGWRCQQKYGKIFKIYIGNNMALMVADPEISKRLTYKMIERSVPAQLRLDPQIEAINRSGLAAASGELWRTMRLAWQPAFQSGSLEGYTHLMDDCAAQVAQFLREKAETGEVVEIWRVLGRMTLAVVGTTAYGVDFRTMPGHTSTQGAALQHACQTMFKTMGLRGGSLWQLANILLPWARPVVSWMAQTFPDNKLLQAKKARHFLRNMSLGLIDQWRKTHPQSIAAVATGLAAVSPHHATPACAAAAADTVLPKEQPVMETIAGIGQQQVNLKDGKVASRQTPQEPKVEDGKALLRRTHGKGVNPGSFLGLMLHTRDSSTGQPFDDEVVGGRYDEVLAAQSNTFILAGYETTANTLSFCIYNITRSPEVQRRLLLEIDKFGRDREIFYSDLDQFSYTEAIVREALRLYPPATLLNRRVKAGGFVVKPGLVVPEGCTVFPFLYGYQRSPEYWPESEQFLPDRWLPEGKHLAPKTPEAWTPFGSGARMCIGWRFALQEAKITLVRLYQHQTYKLLPGQEPLALQQNLTLSPKYGVKVHVILRDS